MSLLSEILRGPFDDEVVRRLDRLFTPPWNTTSTLLVGAPTETEGESQQRQPGSSISSWEGFLRAPRLDLSEQNGSYLVRVDLPGVAKENLDIAVEEGNLLTIAGTRERASEDSGETFFRQERSFGRFQRRVRLPTDAVVDASRLLLMAGCSP